VLNFVLASGVTTVRLTPTSTLETPLLVIIANYQQARRFWQPSIDAWGDFAAYVDVNATLPFLVHGPYLVRTAQIDGSSLALTGDLNDKTALTIWSAVSVTRVTWNGRHVQLKQVDGALQATLSTRNLTIDDYLPDLGAADWRYANSLPELSISFDDSDLTVANRTDTTSVFAPYYGQPWILYADDYGFHVSVLAASKLTCSKGILYGGASSGSTTRPARRRLSTSVCLVDSTLGLRSG
jgi:hypothetical protein